VTGPEDATVLLTRRTAAALDVPEALWAPAADKGDVDVTRATLIQYVWPAWRGADTAWRSRAGDYLAGVLDGDDPAELVSITAISDLVESLDMTARSADDFADIVATLATQALGIVGTLTGDHALRVVLETGTWQAPVDTAPASVQDAADDVVRDLLVDIGRWVALQLCCVRAGCRRVLTDVDAVRDGRECERCATAEAVS
jgi:hypothetical protein